MKAIVLIQTAVVMVVVVAVISFKTWLFGSAGTSAVKAMSGHCGKQYGIESVPLINGNWFCFDSKDEDHVE